MSLFEVNKETCNKDGICAAVCPAGIIRMRKGQCPRGIAKAEEICIRCGHCVAVCPTGSLSHRDMPVEKCPPIQKELELSMAQCEQFLRARRSIRTYKEESVPKAELLKLVELARYAPTGLNSQTVEWLVLGSRDELKRLGEIVVEWMRQMRDNGSESELSDYFDKVIRGCEMGNDVIFRGAPALIVTHGAKADRMAVTSSTIALSHLELAATGMGLGCCWAGYFINSTSFGPMIEALSLEEGHKCTGAMMVGYPKFKYHRLVMRKEPKITWRCQEGKDE